MNKQQLIPIFMLALAAATNAFLDLNCTMPLRIIECTDSLQSIGFAVFLLSSVSSAAYSLFQFRKKHGVHKAQLISTAIAAYAAVLVASVMYLLAPAYDMTVFCATMVAIWLSLSAANRLRRASVGWLLIATFLACVMVFVYTDYPALISFLYAAFSAGAALRHTDARRLAEWGCLGVVWSILALIGIMGLAAVIEKGMPPEGREGLILFEGIFETIPHVNGILAVAAVFLVLAPFYWAAKGTRDPGSKT